MKTHDKLEEMARKLEDSAQKSTYIKRLLWCFSYFNKGPEQIIHFCENNGVLTIVTMIIKFGRCSRVCELTYKAYISSNESERPLEVFELTAKLVYNAPFDYTGKAIIQQCIAMGSKNEGKGYGSLVMGEFLRYIRDYHKNLAIQTVSAWLSPVDGEDVVNKNRRNHFYVKHGFIIEGEWATLDL